MPKTYVGLQFENYTPDYGGPTKQLNSYRFQLPESLDQASRDNVEAIATAVNAKVRYLGDEIIDDISLPCPEGLGGFSPRRLKFILDDASSFSVPFAFVGSAKAAAVTIRDIVSTINSNVKVVCISLIGEKYDNLNDVMGVSFDFSSVLEAGSSSYYSGYINYASDLDVTVPHPVRVLSAKGTPKGSEPPTIFEGIWQECVGTFINKAYACPVGTRNNPRRHRKYIISYNSLGDNNKQLPEERELPVNSTNPSAIKQCGIDMAAKKFVYCIAYQGESYRFLHSLLPEQQS